MKGGVMPGVVVGSSGGEVKEATLVSEAVRDR